MLVKLVCLLKAISTNGSIYLSCFAICYSITDNIILQFSSVAYEGGIEIKFFWYHWGNIYTEVNDIVCIEKGFQCSSQ